MTDKKCDCLDECGSDPEVIAGNIPPCPRLVAERLARPDNNAVEQLAKAMRDKLAKQRAKGYGGWNATECTQQRLSDMLRAHMDKGDPVDVANFCAFLLARGEGIAPAATGQGKQEPVAWADWKVGSKSYEPYRTREQAEASVKQSEIAATQDGPYEVAPLYASPVATQSFQARVHPWMMACFGAEISADHIERNHRFLEEALELVQSTGCTQSEAHQLVDYVFGRPVGEPVQEVGGVMVTLAALCLANGLNMHTAGETELARIWTKVEAIRAKQAAKPKHSPLPMASPVATHGEQAERDAAFEAVRKKLCKLQRYSFFLNDKGSIVRVPQFTGNWIDFQAAHELFDPAAVDAAIDAALSATTPAAKDGNQ